MKFIIIMKIDLVLAYNLIVCEHQINFHDNMILKVLKDYCAIIL